MKLKNFLIDFLRDPAAFKSLLQITKRTEDLKFFGYIGLGILVLTIFINVFILGGIGFFAQLIIRPFFTLSMFLMNFIVFYFMFSTELEPTIALIKRNFL
jgi:hypothetical protein